MASKRNRICETQYLGKSVQTTFSSLDERQKAYYEENGYLFPLTVLDGADTERYRRRFFEYRSQISERLQTLPPRQQYYVFSETHTFLHWVYELAAHPRVLDAVEGVLGPDLLIWNTRWFAKLPGEKMYIGWHQDAAYWGLHPPKVATAWIALSESTAENGAMRMIPGSQKKALLPQRDTYAPDNALSRGQEIAVEVNEDEAVDVTLQPGEMSLHHIGIVHGSKVNQSGRPRIGIAVRFVTPEVEQEGPEKQVAILVRGRDGYGHFDLVSPPKLGQNDADGSRHSEAVRRMLKNLMPEDYTD